MVNKDQIAALQELRNHPGWKVFLDDVMADHQRALEIMTSNPTGKAWEHGQANGHASSAIGVLNYIEAKVAALRQADATAGTPDVQPLSDIEDVE